MVPVIVVFLDMAVFDAIGTLIGIGQQAGFLKDGKLPRATRALTARFPALRVTRYVTSLIMVWKIWAKSRSRISPDRSARFAFCRTVRPQRPPTDLCPVNTGSRLQRYWLSS